MRDSDTLASLKSEIAMLKGTVQQASLIRKKYKESLATLKQNDRQLSESLRRQQLLQNELVEKEKLAALGGLVAGLAHEVNTPLGVSITSNSISIKAAADLQKSFQNEQLSEEELEQFLSRNQRALTIVHDNLAIAAELIRNFKQISVDQHTEAARSFNVLEHIQSTVNAIKLQFQNQNIVVQIDCSADLKVKTYAGPFFQIISNLLQNVFYHAFDSDEEGKINITVKNGEQLTILFSDNGRGMSDEVRLRAFDPFFTTGLDQGCTGLGLNIIYNLIAKTFNGSIHIESEPGDGCLFVINLSIEKEYKI